MTESVIHLLISLSGEFHPEREIFVGGMSEGPSWDTCIGSGLIGEEGLSAVAATTTLKQFF